MTPYKGRYARSGQPWTKRDESVLERGRERGVSFTRIAAALRRTTNAVRDHWYRRPHRYGVGR